MPAFVIFHFTGSFVTYTCNAFNAYPRLNDSFLLASRVDRSLRKFMKARENEYIYISLESLRCLKKEKVLLKILILLLLLDSFMQREKEKERFENKIYNLLL